MKNDILGSIILSSVLLLPMVSIGETKKDEVARNQRLIQERKSELSKNILSLIERGLKKRYRINRLNPSDDRSPVAGTIRVGKRPFLARSSFTCAIDAASRVPDTVFPSFVKAW